MRTLALELEHVLAKEDRLAALSGPCDEHQVRAVDVLGVDVLEGEHKLLEKASVDALFEDGPFECMCRRQLCRFAQTRCQVAVNVSLLACCVGL